MAETVESAQQPRSRRPRRRRTTLLTVAALVLGGVGAVGWWELSDGGSCDLLTTAQITSATGREARTTNRAAAQAFRQTWSLGTPPDRLCVWTFGDARTAGFNLMWLGVSSKAAAAFDRDERLAGEPVDAGHGLKGWAWDAGGAQGVDLLSPAGDRIQVTVQLRSTPPPGSALRLAKLVAEQIG